MFRSSLFVALSIFLISQRALAFQAPSEQNAGIQYDANGAVAGFKLSSGFEKGSDWLSPEEKAALAVFYEALSKDPTARVAIYGYSDSSGAEAANLDVTRARANEVKQRLLKMGLAPERIAEVKGLGAKDPIADNATEAGRLENRRVLLQVVGRLPVSSVAERLPAAATASPMEAAPAGAGPQRLAFGVGYPDLRARVALGHGWDTEGKFAFGDGIQVYSARLIWNFADLGPLKLTAAGEGGWARFDGIETISGTGVLGGAFLGLEYPFAGRLRLSLDAGPAWLQASSEGQTVSTTQMIFNTALYFYIF